MRVALGIVLAGLLAFWPFWLLGHVFVPGDFLYFLYPWKGVAPGHPVGNLELLDVPTFGYPKDTFFNRALHQGDLPLWNPHVFSGSPLVADGQVGLLYPPRLVLHRLFSPGVARTLSLQLHMLAAGLCMYAWLRRRGFLPLAAALGGLTWMLNTVMTTFLELEHIVIEGTFLPLLLLCAEMGLQRRGWLPWAGFALAGGMALLGGNIQLNLYLAAVVGAYLGLRAVQLRAPGALARATLAGGISVALATPTLLPFVEFLGHSQRTPMTWEAITRFTAPLWTYLPGLVYANFWGNPMRGFLINRTPSNFPVFEYAAYVGILPLCLAALALICRRRARPMEAGEVWFWLAGAVLSLLAASGSTLYGLAVGPLPLLSRMIPTRANFALCFCLVMLAVAGMQVLLTDPSVRRVFRGLAWLGIALWLAVLTAVGTGWTLGFPVKIPFDVPPAEVQRAAFSCYLGDPQLYLTLLALLAAAVVASPRLVLVLTALDLLLFCWVFNPHVPAGSLWPKTPAISWLEAQPEIARVDKLHAGPYATLVPYGTQLLTGAESLIDGRYFQALAATGPVPPVVRTIALESFNAGLLDALNLKYVLVNPRERLVGERWVERYAGPDARVYENLRAMPRAYVLGQAYAARDADDALRRVLDPAFDPHREVVVEGALPGPVESAPAEARIVRYTPDEVELATESKAAGVLVLADAYTPDWQATLDGQSVPVLRANALVRGIYLPPGSHRVIWTFRPRAFRTGLSIAAGGLLVLVGLVLGERAWKRR